MKKIITDDFFIGNLGDDSLPAQIRKSFEENSTPECDMVMTDKRWNDQYIEDRKVTFSYMSVHQPNYITQTVESIFHNVNSLIWNLELTDWQTHIQFTRYEGKGGHYGWHSDQDDKLIPKGTRKLSLVYCLSKKSDYTGGEFQIKTGTGKNYTTKFDEGDFIVFPSQKMHRVKPLKSGKRFTMVAWYR